MSDAVTSEIIDFYTDTYQESDRLQRRPQARLEWARTVELLHANLPAAPARILDVGGATGVYARELTRAGYRVRLLDLVPAHVAQARAGDPPVEAEVADARDLPERDGGYDATLLMGPLYHLLQRADRLRALAEAARVTRPGGPVLAAAISRFAGPLDFASTGRWHAGIAEEARRLHTDGVNDPTLGFTQAYFHRVGELRDELRAAGLTDVQVHGVEGPAWPAAEAAAGSAAADAFFAGALEVARIYSAEPDLVATSAHLLAVGTVPPGSPTA